MSAIDGLNLRVFDPSRASQVQRQSMYALFVRLRAEGRPELPSASFTEVMSELGATWPNRFSRRWAVWRQETALAYGEVGYTLENENLHLANFWVYVAPELRRRGIARELLREVCSEAKTAGRRLLLTSTSDTAPDGDAFLQRLGGKIVNEWQMSKLELAEPPTDVVASWLARGIEMSRHFDLVWHDGPHPDEELDAVCRMDEIMNTQPQGETDREGEQVTPELVRSQEAHQAERGIERWTLIARPKGSREAAGYSEVYWHSDSPEVLNQGDTAVATEYRGLGLASWLKVVMLERVRQSRPSVRSIVTGNAASNAPMLSINQRLGFRKLRTSYSWQVEAAQVEAYLDGTS